jgi:hypothetical protein
MLIGYARVSTLDQNLALQRDALKAAGCRRIFADEGVSGRVTARRALEAALTALSAGDTLVVWKLDRLGRSLSHLVTLIAELGARRVNFRSLSDPIDIASSGGRLVMHIMGALAEFERGLIVERNAGRIQAAKKRGVRLGRRPSLTVAQVEHARAYRWHGDSPRARCADNVLKDGGLRRLLSRTKEGRDTLRASEAHPQARSMAPAWLKRSQGRVPLSRHSPKNAKIG